MDPAVVAAVIGAVGAVLAAIVAGFLKPLDKKASDNTATRLHDEKPFAEPSAITGSAVQYPTLWMPTNHSKAEIDYILVHDRDQKHELKAILRKHYSQYVGGFYRMDLVDELSASLNYRIRGVGKKPVLLRIHKRIASEDTLSTLHLIEKHVLKSGIFSDTPFNRCLEPLPSDSGREYEQWGNQFIEARPYAEGVEHFSGRSLNQVKSLAEKYGALQKVLSHLDPSIRFDQLMHLRPDISWFKGDDALFDLIWEVNDRAFKQVKIDQTTFIFHEHRDLFRAIWEAKKPRLDRAWNRSVPLLHDFHPHNTFFQNDKCVLIYDYEAISDRWSETETLAFVIHRFVREYIRRLRDRGFPVTRTGISQIVQLFLEHYQLGGMSVPSRFSAEMGQEIRSINLAKLLLNMAHNYGIVSDPTRRGKDMWLAEVIKFTAYIKEAEFFDLETQGIVAGKDAVLSQDSST